MTMRTVECAECGVSQFFDTWPEQDSDDLLDQYIRAEEWTFKAGLDYCPEHSDE
jgi:hypothetical protein